MRPHLIRGLVVFCAAARYLSFKMAASELCITPSAVSHQIKSLEDQLGYPLFERRTRAIVLTSLGAALYSQVDPLLRSLDAVTTEFVGNSRHRRVLRIALPPFFASEMLIPRLGDFASRYPTLDIRVDTTEVREAEFPSSSDAAVLLLAEPPVDDSATPLFGVQLVPACSPSLAAELDISDPCELGECTLIVHKARPEAWYEWFNAVDARIEGQPRVIHLDSMFAVARAAERGVGVALVPVPLSDAWLQSRALVKLFDVVLDTGEKYYFVPRQGRMSDPDIDKLGRWIIDVCAAHD